VRFKKLAPGTFHDERFRALTAPGPNARYLWLFLLTGPHTCPLPGLFSAGEAGLAEALGWPLAGFRRAFKEIQAQGMAKADWTARVVWIPKSFKYNEPESPSVVKSWLKWVDEIPACDLKREAIEEIRGYLVKMDQDGSGKGPGWAAAWTAACQSGCASASGSGCASSGAGAVAGAGAGAGERVSLPLPPLASPPRNGDAPARRHPDRAWGREPHR
jgi:hypothetical protein